MKIKVDLFSSFLQVHRKVHQELFIILDSVLKVSPSLQLTFHKGVQ